jgi:ribonuclease T
MKKNQNFALHQRFRGFLPVVVDIETAGFDYEAHALLEIAFVILGQHTQTESLAPTLLTPVQTLHFHIAPFPGAKLDPAALAFNKIDPDHPFRFAISEKEALTEAFQIITQHIQQQHCTRAVLVGHNPSFDLNFLNAATRRTNLVKVNPFHRFTSFDTATLGALMYQQSVLARALKAAEIPFDLSQAHSALYDATQTATLFCKIVNMIDSAHLKSL